MRLTTKRISKPCTVVIGKILAAVKPLNHDALSNSIDGKGLLKNVK
jgi:hypothetical protein